MAKLGFSIKSLDVYEWPVDVQVPFINEAGDGDYETHRFTGKFKHLSHSEAMAIAERAREKIEQIKGIDFTAPEAALNFAELTSLTEIEQYMEIWQGWGDDLTDDSGQPLAYSDDTKRKLLEERIIRKAVMQAHRDSQGGEKVRLGNSATSPGAGPAAGAS